MLECMKLIVIDLWWKCGKRPQIVWKWVWFIIVIKWMNVCESDCNCWLIIDMRYCWINYCCEWVVWWNEMIVSDYWDEMCLIVIDWIGELVWWSLIWRVINWLMCLRMIVGMKGIFDWVLWWSDYFMWLKRLKWYWWRMKSLKRSCWVSW